jgi:hypothetical protein
MKEHRKEFEKHINETRPYEPYSESENPEQWAKVLVWQEGYTDWLERKLQESIESEIDINCVHEYEYLSTSGFTGYKCKKCGYSIKD